MSAKALLIVFAGVFTASLALTFPLSLALAWSGASTLGIFAGGVSGSVWGGTLKDARFHGAPIGDVKAKLNPFALLWGTGRLNFHSGIGTLTLVGGAVEGIDDAFLEVELRQLGLSLPVEGRLRLADAALLFRDGECARAKGRLSTDIFAVNFAGPQLVGELSCGGPSAHARLLGESARARIAMDVKVEADGSLQLDTQVETREPAIRDALGMAGFLEQDGVLQRSDRGRLTARASS